MALASQGLSYTYVLALPTEARDLLRKLRGIPIYIYDTITKSLIFVSDSKEWLYQNIGIHHTSLDNCIGLAAPRVVYILIDFIYL